MPRGKLMFRILRVIDEETGKEVTGKLREEILRDVRYDIRKLFKHKPKGRYKIHVVEPLIWRRGYIVIFEKVR